MRGREEREERRKGGEGGGTLPAPATHTHRAHRQRRETQTDLQPADTHHFIRIFKPAMVFFFAPEEAFIKNFGLSNARNTASSSPSTLATI
jgi:hypothetical protein